MNKLWFSGMERLPQIQTLSSPVRMFSTLHYVACEYLLTLCIKETDPQNVAVDTVQ